MTTTRAALCPLLFLIWLIAVPARAATDLPQLAGPVNDFAHVIDARSAAGIERLSRSLKSASGDVVVVVTVPTIEPYADIREYATKLFENGGRGIGDKGKNNGVLILLALKQRKVWIEVGYGLEEWITDRFAGETSRQYMVPEFRTGAYGTGLLVGTARVVGRIAKGKNALYDHAIKGFTGTAGLMPAKGGRVDISDDLVKQAVDHMVDLGK